MNGVAAKLAGFAAVLALVFGGALALGAAAGPAVGAAAQDPAPEHGAPAHAAGGDGAEGVHDMTGDEAAAAPAQGGHADHASGAAPVAKGLAVSQDGYTPWCPPRPPCPQASSRRSGSPSRDPTAGR
jgi:hypothetical protein